MSLLQPLLAILPVHEGHPHVGNEWVHHSLEIAGVLALGLVAWMTWSHLRSRRAGKRSSRTLDS